MSTQKMPSFTQLPAYYRQLMNTILPPEQTIAANMLAEVHTALRQSRARYLAVCAFTALAITLLLCILLFYKVSTPFGFVLIVLAWAVLALGSQAGRETSRRTRTLQSALMSMVSICEAYVAASDRQSNEMQNQRLCSGLSSIRGAAMAGQFDAAKSIFADLAADGPMDTNDEDD